ncbi:hypothetical protein GDO81_023261 [Engystomops pustulosus]|uniref:Uncharacterized protein n=1 Tax=Engystomops pustulosus TaxID=76066 RepID=A0AAV6Z9Q9_ENGPU|nr:hypothetical protein GDO81_023261 [Engystomops pustulosus]
MSAAASHITGLPLPTLLGSRFPHYSAPAGEDDCNIAALELNNNIGSAKTRDLGGITLCGDGVNTDIMEVNDWAAPHNGSSAGEAQRGLGAAPASAPPADPPEYTQRQRR